MALFGHWVAEGPFENLGSLLDTVGVTDERMRGMIMGMRPELNLKQDGDEFELQMITPHVTKTVRFRSGDTVDQTSIVGKTVKSEITVSGDTMTEVHSDPDNVIPPTRVERVATGDQLLVTFHAKDVTATAKYRRN